MKKYLRGFFFFVKSWGGAFRTKTDYDIKSFIFNFSKFILFLKKKRKKRKWSFHSQCEFFWMYFLLAFGTTRESFVSHQPVATLSNQPLCPRAQQARHLMKLGLVAHINRLTDKNNSQWLASHVGGLPGFKQGKLLVSACLPSSQLILNSRRIKLIPAVRKTSQTI